MHNSTLKFFFFFKQKAAYEMRISDWSSDVCSSVLVPCRVQSGTTHKCHGSLAGPVSIWLTAEASPDSTIRGQAIWSWVEVRTNQMPGCEPFFLPDRKSVV